MSKRNHLRSRVRSIAASCLVSALATGLFGCRARHEPPLPTEVDSDGWQLDWAEGSVFYEIFVRSFADSDGDGIGDLQGLIGKLDYLNDGDPNTTDDLGVEGLWLMPIFVSPSYHGYDTVDYENINPDYGSNQDFQEFLEAAHDRGVKVILDLMINHTGRDHPWFDESAASPESARRDWYVWRDEDPGWKQPWGDQEWPTWHEKNGAWYYGIFWAGMPDLNLRNPQVRAEVIRIARLWLDRGVDGFRLDAARHIAADGPGELQNDRPDSHDFWREFAEAVRTTHPSALLVGENWTSTNKIAPYFGSTERLARGDELPMNFNFPLAEAIIIAVSEGDARPVAAILAEMAEYYPSGILDGTFLTNHDMVRVATQLAGDPDRLRSAAAILLTLPGTPFLYYGEEIGMENGTVADGDPAKRTPMAWDDSATAGFTTGSPWRELAPGHERANVASQRGAEDSLFNHYRRLIHLRADTASLRRGSIELMPDPPLGVLAFVRASDDEQVLVAHNLTTERINLQAPRAGTGFGEVALTTGPGVEVGADGLTVPPAASVMIRLE